MILDTSALLAILFQEAEALLFTRLISETPSVAIGAATLVETGIVFGHHAGFDASGLERFIQAANITIIPLSEAHWRTAVVAYEQYGKGRHPAKLNLGDCFSYATASAAGQALLCKGEDFTKTDLDLVKYQLQ